MSDTKPKSKDQYGPPLGSSASSSPSGSKAIVVTPIKVAESLIPTTPSKPSQKLTTAQIVKTPHQKTSLVPLTNKYTVLAQSPSKSPAKPEPTEYLEKPEGEPSLIIEREHFSLSPREIATQLFPTNFHYVPGHPKKTRLFYEFILVDSDSIEVTHNQDKQGEIAFSKIKILKVLTPQDWNAPLHYFKQFSRQFDPPSYNYFDYTDAWYYALYLYPYQHSWFIWFKKGISLKFPQWFKVWFCKVGLDESIFPEEVKPLFKYFAQKSNFIMEDKLLMFTASQAISWILTWDWRTVEIYEDTELYQLYRIFKIKWWAKFNISLIQQTKLEAWIKTYQLTQQSKKQLSTTPVSRLNQESSFLQERSRLIAELAAASSPQEFQKKIDMMSQKSGSDTSSVNSQNYLQENEDDCLGINYHPYT
ncbi:uncharacterized protein LOC130734457 isoform X2 [Lotus japonicus]|uniref:uncharacterized protein LOC130734457 isoform X2 n=1 Tax=Lotus japonicus TaxID=34305 RepID=UPI002587B352|nr:uncharacterized protein LOC130734457 isoform X2 [Lotus japonicus]